MQLVLDWDGTVTEADTLHVAIEEFGDMGVFIEMESEIGRRLTLREVIAVEMATISAPLDDVIPTPSSGLESMLAIFSKAKHPNAARLLSDFILSRPGQEVLSKDTAASPLGDIPGALPLPTGFQRAKIKEAIARAPQLLQLLGVE